MSNGNDTWMPLYIGDYLGDTMELDGAQHGAYLLLLMYYWRNGPLPADDAKLAQIARTDARIWKKTVGPVVRAFFHERDGRLHQKRADIEIAKAEAISGKRRAAAAARWNGHAEPPPGGANGDANADALALHVDMQTASKPDANGDAKGMLRAPALPSHLQSQKEPPRSPPMGGAARRRNPRNAAVHMAREMDAKIAEAATRAVNPADVVEFNAFFQQRKGLANG